MKVSIVLVLAGDEDLFLIFYLYINNIKVNIAHSFAFLFSTILAIISGSFQL